MTAAEMLDARNAAAFDQFNTTSLSRCENWYVVLCSSLRTQIEGFDDVFPFTLDEQRPHLPSRSVRFPRFIFIAH